MWYLSELGTIGSGQKSVGMETTGLDQELLTHAHNPITYRMEPACKNSKHSTIARSNDQQSMCEHGSWSNEQPHQPNGWALVELAGTSPKLGWLREFLGQQSCMLE